MRDQMIRCDVDDSELRGRLRRRLLRVTLPAVRQLARAAEGERVFETDHAIRACITLARLVPVLIAEHGQQPAIIERSPVHPDYLHESHTIVQRMEELRAEALAAKAAGKLCHSQD
jgi:hypothetical protein